MSIEDTLLKLIAAVNECTAAIRENTACMLEDPAPPDTITYDEVSQIKKLDADKIAAAKTLHEAKPEKKATPLADIPPTTYEEVAKLFASVYANGANKADALAAIAPLPHLKDIKVNGEQHPGQLAALKGKLLAAAQKVGALV